MTRPRKYALLALLSVASATCALAQQETPPNPSTAPSAASSPHQREATDKAKHDQMMKDCIKQRQAADSSMSKDAAKKACTQQMKSE
jgi:hypothetical protein